MRKVLLLQDTDNHYALPKKHPKILDCILSFYWETTNHSEIIRYSFQYKTKCTAVYPFAFPWQYPDPHTQVPNHQTSSMILWNGWIYRTCNDHLVQIYRGGVQLSHVNSFNTDRLPAYNWYDLGDGSRDPCFACTWGGMTSSVGYVMYLLNFTVPFTSS